MEARSLDGQVAIAPGGARGIGGAIAERFAAAGASVAVADRDVEEAKRAAASIIGAGTTTAAIAVDIALVMAGSGYGRILNLSSMTAPLGHARYAGYSSAKGAIEAMTRVSAVELGEYGITVNALAPGPVETEFARAALTPERRALRLARMPVGRLGTPVDVADAALFLCRPDAEWITGTVLSIDGGYTAHRATEARVPTSHPAIKKESPA